MQSTGVHRARGESASSRHAGCRNTVRDQRISHRYIDAPRAPAFLSWDCLDVDSWLGCQQRGPPVSHSCRFGGTGAGACGRWQRFERSLTDCEQKTRFRPSSQWRAVCNLANSQWCRSATTRPLTQPGTNTPVAGCACCFPQALGMTIAGRSNCLDCSSPWVWRASAPDLRKKQLLCCELSL